MLAFPPPCVDDDYAPLAEARAVASRPPLTIVPMGLSPRLWLMLLAPPMLWAGNAVVGRWAATAIGPLWLNGFRWLVAFFLLLPFGWRALATPSARAAVLARWPYLAALGLLGIGTYNALNYMALRTSTPVNVTLIASSLPVWSLLVGRLFFHVRPSRRQLAGAALSLAGVAVVLSHGDAASLIRIHFLEGDLLMLAAVFGWAVYSWLLARPPAAMIGERRPDWNWAGFLLAQCLYGFLWIIGSVGIAEAVAPTPPIAWSGGLLAAILFVAAGPSVVAYWAWGQAVARAGPAMAAIFNNLTPLFTALLAAALIGEGPMPYHGVAFFLLVAGIGLSR